MNQVKSAFRLVATLFFLIIWGALGEHLGDEVGGTTLLAQIPTASQRDSPTPLSILQYAAKPTLSDSAAADSKKFPRLAGEFENQKAIVLSVSDLMYQHNGVLVEIVEKTSQRVPLVILVNDDQQLGTTYNLLSQLTCDLSHVRFLRLKLDTIWLRDFGPRIAETDSGAMSMDFFYDGQRPLDDKFPTTWGSVAGAEVKQVQWTLHGGNLLSNGRGLAIASSRIFEDNFIQFPDPLPGMDIEFERRKIVVDGFKQDCNINQLVVLEPLRPEATRHVDMFATFLDADRVVIARVDPRADPVNARLLDRNAALMAQLKVDGKPMRVERITIPPRDDKYWSPYTNIILANNLVLMPIYQSDPPVLVQNAIAEYRRLLPGFQVDTVDMTSMQKLEGALHCMSVNIPGFANLPPDLLSMADTKEKLSKTGHDFNANPNAPATAPIAQAPNPPSSLSLNGRVQAGTDDSASNSGGTAKAQGATPSAETSVAQGNSQLANSQQQAAQSYRRNFIDGSGSFSVDAYAIGFQQQGIILLRADTQQAILVQIRQLSGEDQAWISRNLEKIKVNGPKVRDFISSTARSQ